MRRREFLTGALLAQALRSAPMDPRKKLAAFDYRGVKLLDSRWSAQVKTAREYYLALAEDDILHGFRAAAGLRAPGKPLGGWCATDSSMVLGQWLSGLSRLHRATGDAAALDKAIRLMTEWGKTVKPNGDARMRHYVFDKIVCGLVDLNAYGGVKEALPLLERVTAFASKDFEREPRLVNPYHNTHYYGLPQEWYTLSENLYRAHLATGDPGLKAFAAEWHYDSFWNKFARTSAASNAHGVHAYSHVNTFSGAAMAFAVSGEGKYLDILRNAYDYLQNAQCFATGAYGPNERFMAPDGSLGRALDTRSDTAEVICGSWAGFKLSRYLTEFTGESRYGDWVERLFYNCAGAALPLAPGGRNFYYADYRVGGGMKVYRWDTFTCCSGSLIQNLADYHNLIYYRDDRGLYVNLYVPSEVEWNGVRLRQETGYPEAETISLRIETERAASFPLRFRIPAWAPDVSVKLNGAPLQVAAKPGTWAAIERAWNSGDTVELRIPLRFRAEAVDRQHPNRVAVARGPVVMALDYDYHDPNFMLPPGDAELNKWLVPEDQPAVFRVARPDGRPVRLKFRPYYAMAEGFPYAMYFDRDVKPYALW